jgi:hypothetical protein
MSRLGTTTTALVTAALLGALAVGCNANPDASNSRACKDFTSDYADFTKHINGITGPFGSLDPVSVGDLQEDTNAMGLDGEIHATGDTRKRMKQFQDSMQKVVDTASAGKLDLGPIAGPLGQVNDSCKSSLTVPVVPTTTSPFDS